MSAPTAPQDGPDGASIATPKYMEEATSDEYIQGGVKFMVDLAATAYDTDFNDSGSSVVTTRSGSVVPESGVAGLNDIGNQSEVNVTESEFKPCGIQSEANAIKAEPMLPSSDNMEDNEELTNEERVIAEHRKEAAANWKPSHRKRQYIPHYREHLHGDIPKAKLYLLGPTKKATTEWMNYMRDEHDEQRRMVKESVERKDKIRQADAKKADAEEHEVKERLRAALRRSTGYEEHGNDEFTPPPRGIKKSEVKIKEESGDDQLAPALDGRKDSKVKIKEERSD